MKRITVIAFVALVAGLAAGQYYLAQRAKTARNRLHAELAAIRTYQEGYALRHGHYLLLPDSCQAGVTDQWKALGKAPPDPLIGCFWVTSKDPRSAQGVTAPTIVIVGENRAARLRGTESSDDREPTWTSLEDN